MPPSQKGGELPPIRFDQNDPHLREHRKQINSIVGESTRLNKIPSELQERDAEVQAAFTIARDGLADVLLDPQKRRVALEYCAIGAQVDVSVAAIESKLVESEKLATKKHRNGNYPKPLQQYLGTVTEYVLSLEMVDPLGGLDPALPTLTQTKFPKSGFLLSTNDELSTAQTYARIGDNFSYAEGYQQMAMVTFLAELGISKYLFTGDDVKARRADFRQISVFQETQNDLQSAGVVLNQYFRHYVRYLQARLYGDLTTEAQRTAYPDYDEFSALPEALGVYMAEARDIFNEYRGMLPSTFRAMLENGLIPHLSPEAADKISRRHAEKFFAQNQGMYQLKDGQGRQPYAQAERSYSGGMTMEYFSRLTMAYATTRLPDRSGQLFDNLHRLYGFLGNRIITAEGDAEIAAIDVGIATSNLDIFIIGHQTDEQGNPEVLAIQVDSMGNVYGLPSAYGYVGKPVLNYAIDKALSALEADGFKFLSSEESVEETMIEMEVEAKLSERMPALRLRARNNEAQFKQLVKQEYEALYLQEKERAASQEGQQAHQETAVQVVELKLPVPVQEKAQTQAHKGPQRYSIEVPERILSDLPPNLQRTLLAAVERVKYSPFGSNVMKKLTGIGKGMYRILFSGNRAFLEPDGQGGFRVTLVEKRDSQTYNIARRKYNK